MLSQKNWSDIFDATVSWIVKTPQLLFVIVSARLSGELWVYLYFAYYKTTGKDNKYIDTHLGKTVVGLIWMAAVFVPLYYIFYGMKEFTVDAALEMVVTLVVYSLFVELLATLATIMRRASR